MPGARSARGNLFECASEAFRAVLRGLSFTPSRNQRGFGPRSSVARAAVLDITTAEELDEAIARTAQEALAFQ